MLASCATTDGPRAVRIYAREAYGAVDPGLAATIDFEHRLFVADIHGEHYVGMLLPDPTGTRLKFEPRTASGATMDCSLHQLQSNLWRGGCTDSQHQIYELELGTPFHI